MSVKAPVSFGKTSAHPPQVSLSLTLFPNQVCLLKDGQEMEERREYFVPKGVLSMLKLGWKGGRAEKRVTSGGGVSFTYVGSSSSFSPLIERGMREGEGTRNVK